MSPLGFVLLATETPVLPDTKAHGHSRGIPLVGSMGL